MGASKYRTLGRRLHRHRYLYLFLLLPVIYLLVFCYYPMLGAQLAFRKFNLQDGMWGSPWVGLDNFRRFFESYVFGRVLKNTVVISLYSIIANFPLPIVFALCLNAMRGNRFKRTVQMITYAPHFISTTVLVGMMFSLFNSRIGMYGNLMLALTRQYPPDIVGSAGAFPHFYVWSGVWQNLGWNAIIYIASLSSVDMELHEAAQIDGANRLKRILHIDLPSILPTASILLILDTGKLMSIGFEKVYLMQNSINLQAAETISTYVYKVGLTGNMEFSYSTAIGLFNSVINLTLLILVNGITRKLSKTSLF